MEIKINIKKLTVVDENELFNDGIYTLDDFIHPTPIVFIMTRDGDNYIINTEGHDYARYIIRLLNYK